MGAGAGPGWWRATAAIRRQGGKLLLALTTTAADARCPPLPSRQLLLLLLLQEGCSRLVSSVLLGLAAYYPIRQYEAVPGGWVGSTCLAAGGGAPQAVVLLPPPTHTDTPPCSLQRATAWARAYSCSAAAHPPPPSQPTPPTHPTPPPAACHSLGEGIQLECFIDKQGRGCPGAKLHWHEPSEAEVGGGGGGGEGVGECGGGWGRGWESVGVGGGGGESRCEVDLARAQRGRGGSRVTPQGGGVLWCWRWWLEGGCPRREAAAASRRGRSFPSKHI